MPANLIITDKDGNPIDLAIGVDFGLSRKGLPTYREIKILNTGNTVAKDVMLMSVPKNSSSDVSEDEFNDQLLASQWKTFGFKENGSFIRTLSLGNIKANGAFEGEKDTSVEFNSHFNNTFFCSGELIKEPNALNLSQKESEIKDGTSTRVKSDYFKNCRDVDIEFTLEYVSRVGDGKQDVLVVFPVRMNSKNTGKGYLMIVKYIRETNRFAVSIWRDGKGIESHYDRDYGTKIFESELTPILDKSKKIRLKIYNDDMIRPTFEFSYGGQPMKLGRPGVESSLAYSVKDTSVLAYVNEGELYIDLSISSSQKSVILRNMTITTEEPNQSILIRTLLDDRAEDLKNYSSAVSVSYLDE